MTPTQRSLKALREAGWDVDVCERWIPGANIRRDLFNVADLCAWREGERPLLVQVTSTGVAERVSKIRGNPKLGAMLTCFSIEVHGWRKSAKNGRYVQRVISIDLEAINGTENGER